MNLKTKILSSILLLIFALTSSFIFYSCGKKDKNKPPIINDLWTSQSVVYPGGNVTFIVSASDPDGDALKYSWSCNGYGEWIPIIYMDAFANIVGLDYSYSKEKSIITWSAPNTDGIYKITVNVSDDKSTTLLSKNIVVSSNKNSITPRILIQFYTYPNPYSLSLVCQPPKSPCYIIFRHKTQGNIQRITIEVYNLSGKLVDKFEGDTTNDETCWPFGDRLSKDETYTGVITISDGTKTDSSSSLIKVIE